VILSEADLVAAITRDRAAAKRIGFATLSFDVLRVGDVRSLQAAAANSDRLVVAIVDEGSPRVISAADRAELVDSVRGVDYVIVCAPGRVEPLAALLMPDVRA
jgi:bifunctional ADP-heptose synthase (sugar kinase/adenylyltransferase)